MRNTVLVILALSSIIVIAGCGGGGGGDALSAERGVTSDSSLAGTWQISSNVTPVMGEIVLKQESTDAITLVFDADGTLQVIETVRGATVATSAGTWMVSGDRVQAGWTACDPTLTGRLFGDTLILSANDGTPERVEMHFSRVR